MKNSFSDVSRKWMLPNMIREVPVLIIFGKIHFLLTSENEFFTGMEEKKNYLFNVVLLE